MNITLKTKIRYNGQEYSSPDQMPPEARAAYERALAGDAGSTTQPKGATTRFVFNGQQVASPAELPAKEKKLYDDLIQVLKDGGTADVPPQSAIAETGWLTKSQWQLVLAVAVLIAAAVAILALHNL